MREINLLGPIGGFRLRWRAVQLVPFQSARGLVGNLGRVLIAIVILLFFLLLLFFVVVKLHGEIGMRSFVHKCLDIIEDLCAVLSREGS